MDEEKYFYEDLSERERAAFEVGIKLGALYHTLIGLPISSDPKIIKSIESGFEAAISCQPYVKNIKIKLLKDKISGNKEHQFDYDEINGSMINAQVILEYKATKIFAKVKWIEKLQYPLMFIEKIEKIL